MTALYEVFGGEDAKAQDLNQYRNLFRSEFVYDAVNGYGATGDGITDDKAAIQSAIDAATLAGGGIVFLPPGNYWLGSTIALKGNVSLIGSGDATVLTLGGDYAAVTATTVSNASVRDLKVLGTGVSSNSNDFGLVAMTGSQYIQFDNCTVEDCYRGLMVTASSDVVISNCRSVNDHSDLGAIDVSASSRVMVSDCVVMAPLTHGIDFRGASFYCKAVNCTVTDAGVTGFVISGSGTPGTSIIGCGFIGCTASNSGTAATTFGCGFIVENGALYSTVTGCVSNVAEATGFLVGKGTGDRPAYNAFTGCIARSSSGAGFWDNDAAYTTFVGCTAVVFGTDGFKITPTQQVTGVASLSACAANNGTSATGHAFYVSSTAEGVTLSGCNARYNVGYGIYIDAPRTSVTGCTVMDSDSGGTLSIGGIHLTANASRSIVTGCTSHRSAGTKQDYGIVVAASCTNAIITSNVLYQNTTSGLSDSGTGTVSANNVTA